jgi:hypothetical protein
MKQKKFFFWKMNPNLCFCLCVIWHSYHVYTETICLYMKFSKQKYM